MIQLDNQDGSITYIPNDPANSDYQAYLNPTKTPVSLPDDSTGNK